MHKLDFDISFCRFTFLKTKGQSTWEKHFKPQKPLSWLNQAPQSICSLPSQLNSSCTGSGLLQTESQEVSCKPPALSTPRPPPPGPPAVCLLMASPGRGQHRCLLPPGSLLQLHRVSFPLNFMVFCSSLITPAIFYFLIIEYIVSLLPEHKTLRTRIVLSISLYQKTKKSAEDYF